MAISIQVIKTIIALLNTTLPSYSDTMARQSFKALLPVDKEEKKKVCLLLNKLSLLFSLYTLFSLSFIYFNGISSFITLHLYLLQFFIYFEVC